MRAHLYVRGTLMHGVAAMPVSSFFTNEKDERVIRFCFAKTEELLVEAAEQLAGV